ncbi:hypothetical protein HanRHA438_Chr12g0571221 [Helianthus annuus]|nr:hypothetical protein HanRHA438_Chr12g0571221 [Helianthus annuus]
MLTNLLTTIRHFKSSKITTTTTNTTNTKTVHYGGQVIYTFALIHILKIPFLPSSHILTFLPISIVGLTFVF